jgi:RHS repeat-associated protein
MLGYNGLDDRVSQVSTTLGLSTTTRYVYDPDGRVIGEYGASATDVKAEYLWQSAEVGAGGIFGGDDGTGGYAPIGVATAPLGGTAALYWVHSNHLGVPLATTDASGAPVTPSGYTQLAYPGQMKTLPDLWYNRHRDFDPTTGRYVQADPIGLAGGENPYSYAGGNALKYVDPEGLEGVGWWNSGPILNAQGARDGKSLSEMIGATRDFQRNYNDMRNANTIGADKYFHCKANCAASKRGSNGASIACSISNLREITDQRLKGDARSASLADQFANRYGRDNSNQGSCSSACQKFRPPGLPARY